MAIPIVSICIPAYNRTTGLHRLLQSIAIQSYTAYEIIITDDSTTNDVATLVLEWQLKLPITYIKNNIALGSPQNWNKAISLSNTNWIKLMHDDDWFTTDNSLATFMEHTNNADFIFSGNTNVYLNESRAIEELLTKENELLLQKDIYLLVFKNVIGHPSNTLYKKTALEYNKNFKWVVDVDFYINYIEHSKNFSYINQILINTGIDDTTVSNSSYKNPEVEIPEYLAMIAQYSTNIQNNNKFVFNALWTLVKKFKIKTIDYVQQNGYTKQLPLHIQTIINYQKKIPHIFLKQTPIGNYFMKKLYNKLQNKN
jgi:glycosyltransferase involved in cell wall biosynthesis